jgi:hypothetical protein
MEEGYGLRALSTEARLCIFRFPTTNDRCEENINILGRILIVEDDSRDVELTLTALEEYNLANEVVVVHDSEETPCYLL